LTGIDPGQLDRICWISIQRMAAVLAQAVATCDGEQRWTAADSPAQHGIELGCLISRMGCPER
jgi:hypothetical protein